MATMSPSAWRMSAPIQNRLRERERPGRRAYAHAWALRQPPVISKAKALAAVGPTCDAQRGLRIARPEVM